MAKLDKDKLVQLYQVDLLTDGEIGQRCGLAQSSVSRLRKKHGIPTLTKS